MAVTVSYKSPYATAPSRAQQHYTPHNQVIATVSASAAGDQIAIITHDFGFSAAELALGYPSVQITSIANAGTSLGPWFESSEGPNFTVLEKGTVDAGRAVKVVIQGRPVN